EVKSKNLTSQISYLFLSFSKHFLSCCNCFFNGSFQVESCFRKVIQFTVHNHVEPFNGVFNIYKYSRNSCKLLRNVEWLRQETLHTTCAVYSKFIFFRKFFHPKNGDNILKFFIALK